MRNKLAAVEDPAERRALFEKMVDRMDEPWQGGRYGLALRDR